MLIQTKIKHFQAQLPFDAVQYKFSRPMEAMENSKLLIPYLVGIPPLTAMQKGTSMRLTMGKLVGRVWESAISHMSKQGKAKIPI